MWHRGHVPPRESEGRIQGFVTFPLVGRWRPHVHQGTVRVQNDRTLVWSHIIPGCANFALKSTANDFEEEFGASTANFLRNDFYVDDGLKSAPLVDEAVKLIASVKQMCSRGGFRLHKFVSNSREGIRRIPEQDRADGVKELDLDLDSLPLGRALSVHWCVESDCFQFTIVLQDKPCTKTRNTLHCKFDFRSTRIRCSALIRREVNPSRVVSP